MRPPISKHCPYKKLLLCVLPQYRSEECSEFQLQFSNVVKEVLAETKDMTVEFINTIDGVHTLPNQLLLAILFRELLQVVIPFKVHLITTEKRMMNMYKYELMKTEACSIKNLN